VDLARSRVQTESDRGTLKRRRRPFAATAALERPSGPSLALAGFPLEYLRQAERRRGMIVSSIGLLVTGLLILFGLCVVVAAAAWLPDLPPPAS
jgi:hypothetical protein